MKLNNTNECPVNAETTNGFKRACAASCQKILTRIARAKAAILAESRDTLASQERLLRLALNEAEALAWQTMYPHLLFPTLATEKIQAVTAWDARQRLVWQTSPLSALAA